MKGLALASYHLFVNGHLSSVDSDPLRADGEALENLTVQTLSDAFQVSEENPLVGLEEELSFSIL